MKKVLTVLLIALIAMTTVFAQASGEKAEDKTYTILLTCSNTAGRPHTDALIEACEVIKEKTNGHVVIEFHGGGEMFTGAEGIEAVMNNANVMYITDANTFQDYCPELATITAPFLLTSSKQAAAFLASDFWKGIEKESEKAGVHQVISDLILGPRNILSTVPVRTLADCAKLNIRVPDNTTYISIFKALGANYLPMGTADMVTAMSTGMCNGMEGTAATCISYIKSLKNPYYILDGHLMNVVSVQCGTEFWNSIPAKYQQIITEEFEAAAAKSNKVYDEQFEEYIAKYEAEGVPVIKLSDEVMADFVKAVTPYAQSLPRYNEFKKAVDSLKF